MLNKCYQNLLYSKNLLLRTNNFQTACRWSLFKLYNLSYRVTGSYIVLNQRVRHEEYFWWSNARFLKNDENYKEEVDSMGVVELDITFNEFAVMKLHICKKVLNSGGKFY